MCKIRPFVDLQSRTLTVSAPGMPNLVLPLGWGIYKENNGSPRSFGDRARDGGARGGNTDDAPMIVRVCGNRRVGVTCTASASAWFTRFIGVPCSLVRAAAVSTSPVPALDGQNASAESRILNGRTVGLTGGVSTRDKDRVGATPSRESESVQPTVAAERAFANEAQYLLISRASVDKVNDVIRETFFADGRIVGEGSGGEGKLKGPEKVRENVCCTGNVDGFGEGLVQGKWDSTTTTTSSNHHPAPSFENIENEKNFNYTFCVISPDFLSTKLEISKS